MKVSELVKGKRYGHPKFYWLLYTGEHYHSFPGEWYVFRDGKRRIAFEEHDVKLMEEVG